MLLFLFPLVAWVLLVVVWAVTYPGKGSLGEKWRGFVERFTHKQTSPTGTYIGLCVLLQFVSGVFFPWPTSGLNLILPVVGTVITLTGFTLAFWAKLTMRGNWGMPAQHTIERQKELVVAGPFRLTRNPIYLGLLAMVVGTGVILQSYFLVLAPLLYLHMRQIVLKEEFLLGKHFGKEYLTYKSNVSRFI